MLGPVSPSPTRLKSCAGSRATARTPSHSANTDTSGPGHPLLDHDGAPGLAEGFAGELGAHVRLGVRQVTGDQHPLARGQPVRLHDVGGDHRAQERDGVVGVGEDAVPRGGHAGRHRQLLHVGLGALHLRTVGTGAEHHLPLRSQDVGQAVHEGLLWSDHEEVGVQLLRRRVDGSWDPGVARGDDHVGRAPEDEREARLATAGSDHDDPHGLVSHALSWTYWSRPGPTPEQADRDADLLLEAGHVVLAPSVAGDPARWPR